MNWKEIGKKLLFLPIWLMLLLTVCSAAGLAFVFIRGWSETPVAYGVYVLSFYTLCTVTVWCALVLPKQYKQLRQQIYDNPLGNRLMTDRAYRTRVSLHISLTVSMLYVAVNVWSWYVSRSWWFVTLAVYYVIMALMRYLLLGYMGKNKGLALQWRRCRLCACILLLINLSLSGAVLMILYQNRGYDYPGILIYVMAMYTFYSTTHAIVDIIKYRKLGSPMMSTAKIVSLSGALVSMLNLETAMFAQFGADMAIADQQLMIILTGAGISVTVVTLSVILIVKATKEIRRITDG